MADISIGEIRCNPSDGRLKFQLVEDLGANVRIRELNGSHEVEVPRMNWEGWPVWTGLDHIPEGDGRVGGRERE